MQEVPLAVAPSAPSEEASAAISTEETGATQEAAVVELVSAAAEVAQEVSLAVAPSAPSEASAAISTEETGASHEAAVIELAPAATEVVEEVAAVAPSALPEVALASISTEVPAAAEMPELSPLGSSTKPIDTEPHTVRDPSQNVITLVHDHDDGIVPITEPKTVADGDGEGHERAKVA